MIAMLVNRSGLMLAPQSRQSGRGLRKGGRAAARRIGERSHRGQWTVRHRGLKAVMAVAVIAMLVGCGGRRMPDLEPPEVSIVELFSEGEQSRVQLRLDNPVAAPMDIDWISLEIEIGGNRSTIDMAYDLTVPPLGSEVLERPIELKSEAEGSLDYDLAGEVRLASGRTLAVKRDGRLYPTPGKPGSFR